MNDAQESVNRAEYSYEKAVTKKDKLKRALYFTGVVLLMILPILTAMIFHVYFIMYIMPLVLIIGVPLAKFFFRYFQNEYKYTVERSSFKMELIHGKAKPKLLYDVNVNDMEFAKPAIPDPDRSGYDTVSYCCVSETSPDLYIASFRDKNGKKVLLYFEGSKKALKIMNYYNKNVVVSDALRH